MHLMSKIKEFVENVEKSGAKPLYELTPEQARRVLSDVQKFHVSAPETEDRKSVGRERVC